MGDVEKEINMVYYEAKPKGKPQGKPTGKGKPFPFGK